MQRQHQFVTNHHQFGGSNFNMSAKVKDFFMIYLKLFLTVLGLSMLLGALIAAAIGLSTFKDFKSMMSSNASPSYTQQTTGAQHEGGFIKVANTEPIAKESAEADAAKLTDTLSADEQAELEAMEAGAEPTENLSEEDMLKDLTPEQRAEYDKMMKQLEEQGGLDEEGADEHKVDAKPKTDLEKVMEGLSMGAGGLLAVFLVIGGMLLYLGVIFSFVAYIKSRVGNLVLNNTTLDHVGFHSTQRMRDLLWIYVSNALVLMFTMGLATPWAQVRLAKYRAEHLVIVGETDWDKFVGEKKEVLRATGEEIADFFDVDLSFGF